MPPASPPHSPFGCLRRVMPGRSSAVPGTAASWWTHFGLVWRRWQRRPAHRVALVLQFQSKWSMATRRNMGRPSGQRLARPEAAPQLLQHGAKPPKGGQGSSAVAVWTCRPGLPGQRSTASLPPLSQSGWRAAAAGTWTQGASWRRRCARLDRTSCSPSLSPGRQSGARSSTSSRWLAGEELGSV